MKLKCLHMILYTAGNLLFLGLLFFIGIMIADKVGSREESPQNRNIRIAFSLYKPIIITIICLIAGLNITIMTPDQSINTAGFIHPILLSGIFHKVYISRSHE